MTKLCIFIRKKKITFQLILKDHLFYLSSPHAGVSYVLFQPWKRFALPCDGMTCWLVDSWLSKESWPPPAHTSPDPSFSLSEEQKYAVSAFCRESQQMMRNEQQLTESPLTCVMLHSAAEDDVCWGEYLYRASLCGLSVGDNGNKEQVCVCVCVCVRACVCLQASRQIARFSTFSDIKEEAAAGVLSTFLQMLKQRLASEHTRPPSSYCNKAVRLPLPLSLGSGSSLDGLAWARNHFNESCLRMIDSVFIKPYCFHAASFLSVNRRNVLLLHGVWKTSGPFEKWEMDWDYFLSLPRGSRGKMQKSSTLYIFF